MLLKEVLEIKENQIKQIEQTAVLTHIIHEHEKRSTQLESRVLPLEDDFKFRAKLYNLAVGGGGLLAVISVYFKFLR